MIKEYFETIAISQVLAAEVKLLHISMLYEKNEVLFM